MQKCCQLGTNLWHWRSKFLSRVVTKDGQHSYQIYNKYNNQKLKDFCYEVSNLKSLAKIMSIFEEDLNFPVVEDIEV
jgi:hypothetical protein